ncbi:hypothetical protein, partial [Moorena sp. SIO3A2]|uniref:hypothetical protein n=1 Tax=Moorena sp. SIO3A2 TaxID=2607841 RepID=UPI00257D12F0
GSRHSVSSVSKRELGKDFERACSAVRAGHSLLILGEAGVGKGEFAQGLYEELLGEFSAAIAIYKGSGKKFFQALAFQLDIPTENDEGKPLTMDQLKEEIAANCNDSTLLIFPEAKRLTTGIRYWLEDLMASGVRVVCLAVANPGRDIFLEMLEIELELPSDQRIREVMRSEAKRQGLNISESRLAELQPLAGRNPMVAKKVVRNELLGINQNKPEHTQYVVIMPIIIAALMSFGIIRFIGMGTGNKSLYIFGGVSLVAGMTLKQLGSIRGARKRLGQ